jgi:uncharacterized protein YggT (Ycf19 family)
MARAYDNIHTRFEGLDSQEDLDDGVQEETTALILVMRVVQITSGVIVSLLTLRFILMLFAANQANPYSNFVFLVTKPFVAPFFNLFNSHPVYGIANIEVETLSAVLFYVLVGWLVVRLLALIP